MITLRDGSTVHLQPQQRFVKQSPVLLHMAETLEAWLIEHSRDSPVHLTLGDSQNWRLTRGFSYRVVYWHYIENTPYFNRDVRVRPAAPEITEAQEQDSETQETEEETMQEKNMAALIRKDTVTVNVKLCEKLPAGVKSPLIADDEKAYTFVTHLSLTEGQYVVVDTANGLKVAKVESVDDTLQISQGSPTKYRWVVSTLDMAPFDALQEQNKQIEEQVAQLQRRNMQRSFREQVLGALSEDERLKLPDAVR